MAYFKRYFKVDIRDPYMGNTLPLKFEVHLPPYLGNEEGEPKLIVVDSEGRRHYAVLISLEMFNE